MHAQRRRFGAIGVAAALACTLLAACANNDVVATVNGQAITRAEYDEHLERDNAAARDLLAHMVNDMLIDQYAKNAGITVSDEEIKKRIASVKARFPGDAWNEMLRTRNLSEADVSFLILHQLILEKAVAKYNTVAPADVEAYYQKNRAQFDKEHATLASATPQIVQTLRTQQIGPLSEDLVQRLQRSAKIVYLDPRYDNLFAAQPATQPVGSPHIPSPLTK
jgi:hypothetical protein